jgi:2-iminoacetate synthase
MDFGLQSNEKRLLTPFSEILAQTGLDRPGSGWLDAIGEITDADVERALAQPAGRYTQQRLLALVSPAAEKYLEEMARQAHELTLRRFGRTIQLYAPLYVSNYCVNKCLYCGFNTSHQFKRTRLTIEEALAEADVIAAEGFRHILLVSGEDTRAISVEYLAQLAAGLKEKFASISAEVYPMDELQYAAICKAGIDGVTLYQETFDREAYATNHPSGAKADYDYRLETHDRAARAGMRRLGLGVLLGLTDWRLETLTIGEHASYLMRNYWRAQVSFSFPRIRPATEVQRETFRHTPTDAEMVQMMLALRLCFGDAGLTISTRERAAFRDHLVKLGVTQMSAGSRTSPGGYTTHTDSTEQFRIDDDRTAAQVAQMIKQQGFEAVWKDWDSAFTS